MQLRLRSSVLVPAQSCPSILGQPGSPLHHRVPFTWHACPRTQATLSSWDQGRWKGWVLSEQESCVWHRGQVPALEDAVIQCRISGPQPCGLGLDLTMEVVGRGSGGHWSICSQHFHRTPASWRVWAQTSCTPTYLQGKPPVWSQLLTDFNMTAFLMYSLCVNYIIMLISQLSILLSEAVFSGWQILKDKVKKK